ncbi:MAG: helix-turn-helix domain-containing protein, partial [Coriobacteriales bacterium]|nr:helix-turn-helix domain-containing protein [Coriobacteriales bacterium]
MREHAMTAQQAARKWGISDRRVRVLCSEGKVPGAVKEGKSYRIPSDAVKPADGRGKKTAGGGGPAARAPAEHAPAAHGPAERWLKWKDDVIGTIDADNAVRFTRPAFNEVVSLYTNGASSWSPEQFVEFLSERVVGRDRRDIERILFRCALSHYDVVRIAEVTRGIHPKDLLWVAHSEGERLDAVVTDVFASVFHQRVDLAGDSIDTPEGYNIKRYGAHNGQYGIYKQRISPLATDVESEVAVCLLAQRLGVPCCPAFRVGEDTVFSAFLYDFSKEHVVHFRRLFDGARSDNEYRNLVSVRPQYREEIARMILLDFITRQDDRHLSNIAIKMTDEGESFYPLYDNGRSLFYEDTEEMVSRAVADPEAYATSFGFSGTYWDYAREIARERDGLEGLLDLDVSSGEVAAILKEAGFAGYRFDGALTWIMRTIDMLKRLGLSSVTEVTPPLSSRAPTVIPSPHCHSEPVEESLGRRVPQRAVGRWRGRRFLGRLGMTVGARDDSGGSG